MLSDLRESGSIEQDADVVLMLYRENYYNSTLTSSNNTNDVQLIIAKQRNGPVGTINLQFDPKFIRFSSQ